MDTLYKLSQRNAQLLRSECISSALVPSQQDVSFKEVFPFKTIAQLRPEQRVQHCSVKDSEIWGLPRVFRGRETQLVSGLALFFSLFPSWEATGTLRLFGLLGQLPSLH